MDKYCPWKKEIINPNSRFLHTAGILTHLLNYALLFFPKFLVWKSSSVCYVQLSDTFFFTCLFSEPYMPFLKTERVAGSSLLFSGGWEHCYLKHLDVWVFTLEVQREMWGLLQTVILSRLCQECQTPQGEAKRTPGKVTEYTFNQSLQRVTRDLHRIRSKQSFCSCVLAEYQHFSQN